MGLAVLMAAAAAAFILEPLWRPGRPRVRDAERERWARAPERAAQSPRPGEEPGQ